MSFNKSLDGFRNEIEFIKAINNKKFCELDFLIQEFVESLYPNIKKDDEITCYKNHQLQKADMFIVVNNVIKGIGIKKGLKNSVHTEPISEFIHFLIENKIPKNIVEDYLKYQYADGTTNGTGQIRLSVKEYKKDNQDTIDKINEYFNKNNILINAINRFVLQGRNSEDKIDAIIHGTVNDFIWIKSDDIRKIIFKKKGEYSSGVHFSILSCQPLDRCLNYNLKYDKKRFCVQIKWYNLYDNIIECLNDKCLFKRYLD